MERIKLLVKRVFGSLGIELRRTAFSQRSNQIRRYFQGGAIPWSAGYAEAKQQFIAGVLTNPGLMETFRTAMQLPSGHGVGFDERCVEYPWLLARLGDSNETILDAGSVLNHAFILDHVRFQKRRLHILTLAPEGNCFWGKGISYLFADLREIPVRDSYYGNIACISTLEHIGCDNSELSGFDVHRESRFDDFTIAMRELNRVLKPNGTLFITVPYGLHRSYGTFQQFDADMVSRAIVAFGSAKEVHTVFYRYTREGWNVATQEECASCEFAEWIVKVWRGEMRAEDVVLDPDGAAAARAVACVRIVKA